MGKVTLGAGEPSASGADAALLEAAGEGPLLDEREHPTSATASSAPHPSRTPTPSDDSFHMREHVELLAAPANDKVS